MHQGEGSLTGQAAWQRQLRPLPELRVSPADAEELGLEDLADVQVETESGGVRAFVRVSGNVAPGTLSISEGYAAARQLMPCVIESEQDAVVSNPAAVTAVKPARGAAAVK
jgi:anaerobic selenocysteine-containing dehydrogenase